MRSNEAGGAAEREYAVVVPFKDEVAHLETVVSELSAQIGDDGVLVLVDGQSTDGSQDIAKALAKASTQVIYLENPRVLQASGVNAAAKYLHRHSVPFFIRADAHAHYPIDFVERVRLAAEQTAASSVVVPMETLAPSGQEYLADLFNSPLGNGASPHRLVGTQGDEIGVLLDVEHGHHAGFSTAEFVEAGGYDEAQIANEDAELDLRLRALGKRIVMNTSAAVGYIPRTSFLGTFRQFSRNGYFRAETMLKHRVRPQLRQLIPVSATVAVMASLVLTLLLRAMEPVATVVGGYLAVAFVALIMAKERTNLAGIFRAVPYAITCHLAFGTGYLSRLLGLSPKPFVTAEQLEQWRLSSDR